VNEPFFVFDHGKVQFYSIIDAVDWGKVYRIDANSELYLREVELERHVEFDDSALKQNSRELVSTGKFGTVYKIRDHAVWTYAEKELKPTGKILNEKYWEDLKKVKSLSQNHNILRVFGSKCEKNDQNVITKELIYTEFCDLQDLHSNAILNQTMDRTNIKLQIEKGVKALHHQNFVHKHLTSKHILLTTDNVSICAKIGGFFDRCEAQSQILFGISV